MPIETRPPVLLRFGVFEVDLRAGELRKQGKRIKLQEQTLSSARRFIAAALGKWSRAKSFVPKTGRPILSLISTTA